MAIKIIDIVPGKHHTCGNCNEPIVITEEIRLSILADLEAMLTDMPDDDETIH